MYWSLFLSLVTKETTSPTKKKKPKSIDAGKTETVPAEETDILDGDNEKNVEEKPSGKEEKDEVKM
jgi:hypothetical protein